MESLSPFYSKALANEKKLYWYSLGIFSKASYFILKAFISLLSSVDISEGSYDILVANVSS